MKLEKVFGVIFLAGFLFIPTLSWSANLVIGENLKPGMPLSDAIKILGIPSTVVVHRGPDSSKDSIEIDYSSQGLKIRALNSGSQVEAIELTPSFKGSFASGLKLGDKFPEIIKKYGVPQTLTSQTVRYPDQGLYFLLNKDSLLSAKTFMKGTQLVHLQMMNP